MYVYNIFIKVNRLQITILLTMYVPSEKYVHVLIISDYE